MYFCYCIAVLLLLHWCIDSIVFCVVTFVLLYFCYCIAALVLLHWCIDSIVLLYCYFCISVFLLLYCCSPTKYLKLIWIAFAQETMKPVLSTVDVQSKEVLSPSSHLIFPRSKYWALVMALLG